jgi:hypothetical protein
MKNVSGKRGQTYIKKCVKSGLQPLTAQEGRAGYDPRFNINIGKKRVKPDRFLKNVASFFIRGTFFHKFIRTHIRRPEFSVRVRERWNGIPVEVKDLASVPTFKKNL